MMKWPTIKHVCNQSCYKTFSSAAFETEHSCSWAHWVRLSFKQIPFYKLSPIRQVSSVSLLSSLTNIGFSDLSINLSATWSGYFHFMLKSEVKKSAENVTPRSVWSHCQDFEKMWRLQVQLFYWTLHSFLCFVSKFSSHYMQSVGQRNLYAHSSTLTMVKARMSRSASSFCNPWFRFSGNNVTIFKIKPSSRRNCPDVTVNYILEC